MTIILDQYAIPEQGSFEIRQTVDITFTAKQAQRKVDTWLLNEVSMMMGAEAPTLVVGARTHGLARALPLYRAPRGAGRDSRGSRCGCEDGRDVRFPCKKRVDY